MKYTDNYQIDFSNREPDDEVDELFFKRWSPRSFKKEKCERNEMKIYFNCLLLMALLLSCAPKEEKPEIKIQVPDLSVYEYRQTKDVVQLVYDAVNEIELKGVDAFADFRIEGSKWYHDDTYVFVWNMAGIRLVYPPDPSKEKQNMSKLKDENGKPIGKEFIETAQKGEGWVFYMWNKPAFSELYQKTTFIKKAVDHYGVSYLVGCGLYDMPVEKVLEQNTPK
ncbi:MAG: cache domain-containing protein [Candidatus Cloacimonadales bacterium]|nr:cache domain-containing protein [Candidatus Cloacimonadales bacterium]